MRLLTLTLTLLLCACSPVYKLSTSQGNVLDQTKLAQLEIGMTPEQVLYLIGTPLVVNEFNPARWDYVSYFRSGEGKERKRAVTIFFESGRVARISDTQPPVKAENPAPEQPAAEPTPS